MEEKQENNIKRVDQRIVAEKSNAASRQGSLGTPTPGHSLVEAFDHRWNVVYRFLPVLPPFCYY